MPAEVDLFNVVARLSITIHQHLSSAVRAISPIREDLNKAYYRSTRRSTVELETYLGKFWAGKATNYSRDKLQRYLQVLSMDDRSLQKILLEDAPFPEGSDKEILKELKSFHPYEHEKAE